MEKKLTLNELMVEIKQNAILDDGTYIVDLPNCNGLTLELLDTLEKYVPDVKFKIKGDNYNQDQIFNENTDMKLTYNYDITQMKQIITIFEKIASFIPKEASDDGKFLIAYLTLMCIRQYDHSRSDNNLEMSKIVCDQRSLYGFFVEGMSVCYGDSLAVSNLLSYIGVNNKQMIGTGRPSENIEDGHSWNIVEIKDKWFNTDLTWDASLSPNPNDFLQYCLVVNPSFDKSHLPFDESKKIKNDCQMAEEDYNRGQLISMASIIMKQMHLPSLVDNIKAYREEINKQKTAKNSFFGGSFEDLLKDLGMDSILSKK